MKIGNIEGSPEEIKDLVENFGLNAEALFDLRQNKPNLIWLITPIILVGLAAILIAVCENVSQRTFLLFIIGGFGSAIWLVANLQIRFDNLKVTIIVLICVLLIFLLAAQSISLIEIFNFIKDSFKSK